MYKKCITYNLKNCTTSQTHQYQRKIKPITSQKFHDRFINISETTLFTHEIKFLEIGPKLNLNCDTKNQTEILISRIEVDLQHILNKNFKETIRKIMQKISTILFNKSKLFTVKISKLKK